MTGAPDELTVVIPVRDQAEFVADALASVLDQAGGPPNIVVIDDGSTDASGDVARRVAPTAAVLRTSGLGPAAARNLGVDSTATPFIAFCDADDLWPRERCRRDLALLASHPEAPAVLGRARFQAESPALLAHYNFASNEPVGQLWSLCGLTVRRQAWDKVGPLDPSLTAFEDHDWFLRANEAGVRPLLSDAVSFTCRVRPESSTSAPMASAGIRERWMVLRRAAARRRLTPPAPS